MLYPQANAHRTAAEIGGFWRFLPDPSDAGEALGWARGLPGEAGEIAVPGAWNEQLAERGLLNYVGAAWYETTLALPEALTAGRRVALYVGAAHQTAAVWLNGTPVGGYDLGFLPFELDLTAAWRPGDENVLVIRCDSRLTLTSLPQDTRPTLPPYDEPRYAARYMFPPTRFDFFPYGGLVRPVWLVTTPAAHLSTLHIDARLDGSLAVEAEAAGGETVTVEVTDADGRVAATLGGQLADGRAAMEGRIDGVRAWCPADPHLYTARVAVTGADGAVRDSYALPFGAREVRVDGGRLLLNGEPLYLTGYGKHEDLPIVGRGSLRAGLVKDFELMRWTGANSFRTSHYPYDEETLMLADRLGFLVVSEVPAVSIGLLHEQPGAVEGLLATHTRYLDALVARDRAHPSVVLWSTVNEANLLLEPGYVSEASEAYFRAVYEHTRARDATRPVIAITYAAHAERDPALAGCDVIGLNRYYGWYSQPADLTEAARLLGDELDRHWAAHGKPILMTEFGADTVPGAHATTAGMFTEEFQEAFLAAYCCELDARPFVCGAHVWNFADFRTPQHFRRVVLNLKGVFTRTRDPKRAAFWLRDHWRALARVAPRHRPAPTPGDAGAALVPDLLNPAAYPARRVGGA